MTPKHSNNNEEFYLYDAEVFDSIGQEQFQPAYYRDNDLLLGQATGRGTTYFVQIDSNNVAIDGVLRHYRRGGFIARLNEDHYLWSGLEKTRAWREWYLLAEMLEQDLPVPTPLAARVQRSGMLYKADLLTRKITETRSLAEALSEGELTESQWRHIGQTIQRIHRAGYYHADLNAHNILLKGVLTASSECYVIDFDKGEKRKLNEQWQQANLVRLRRSLNKLKQNTSNFMFDDKQWQQFLLGYAAI